MPFYRVYTVLIYFFIIDTLLINLIIFELFMNTRTFLFVLTGADTESQESALESAFRKLRINTANTIILYPDLDSSNSGSRKYKARIIQTGHWVRNKDQKIIEVLMGEQLFKEKGLLTEDNTPNYAELIRTALEKIEAQRHYLLYVTDDNDESIALVHQALMEKSSPVFNAVILFPKSSHENHAESVEYIARIIQNGVCINDNISIGKHNIQTKGLQTQKSIRDYFELINQALVYANLVVPEQVKHRVLMNHRNDPETLAGLRSLNDLEEIKHVTHQKLPKTDLELFKIIYDLAKNQNKEELEKIIKDSITIDILQGDFTPCALLAFENNKNAVDFLIKNFNVNSGEAVFGATRGNNLDLLKTLLAKGNADIPYAGAGAAVGGNIQLIKFFIAQGAPVDNLVYYASRGKHTKIVKILTDEFGSNIETINMALRGAATSSDVDLMDYFIARGAEPKYALIGAAEEGHIAFLNHLLEKPIYSSINKTDYLNPAVFNAAKRGDFDLVNDLIILGASKNSAARGAVVGGHKQHLDKFLDENNVNNVVQIAAKARQVNLVNYLIEVKGASRYIALQGTAIDGNINLFKKLNPPTNFQADETILELASINGHTNIVNYYIDCMKGHRLFNTLLQIIVETALYAAAKGGHTQLINYLLKINKDKRVYAVCGAAQSKDQMKLLESLISNAGFFETDKLLTTAIDNMKESGYVKNKNDMLFILSEFRNENFRKSFIKNFEKQNFLPSVNMDAILLEANQISEYKAHSNLSFNQALACLEYDIHGLFTYISQTTNEKSLSQLWIIVATYLFPLHEVEAHKIQFAIKQKHVLNDVNNYYASLGKLSYFSQAATKARELMDECKKAKSEKRLYKVINKVQEETDETLYKVVSKYQSKK